MTKRYRVQTITYGRKDSSMPRYKGYFVYDMLLKQNMPNGTSGLLSFETREAAQAKADELNQSEERSS